MLPITGPYTKQLVTRPSHWPSGYVNPGNAYATNLVERTWYRQKRPYDRPLSYTYLGKRLIYTTHWADAVNSMDSSTGWTVPWDQFTSGEFNSLISSCKNVARARLLDKVGESSGWLISLVQRKQAMAMMESRLFQLYRFARDLRHGKPASALRQLTSQHSSDGYWSSRRRGVRETSRGFSNSFLEAHFGWEPVIRDIYNSAKLLSDPIPYGRVKAHSSKLRQFSKGTNGALQGEHALECQVVCGCNVRVSSPNLFLANQLGLINPAQVLWDAIPWSFVVGWFVNIDQFLAQFTDLAGLTIEQPYYTIFTKDVCKARYPSWNTSWAAEAVSVRRTTGSLPEVTLKLSPFRLSPVRAATAISLLLQQIDPSIQPKSARIRVRS